MIRPEPARWFEALCARDDAFVLLEALAMHGCAEIEWHAGGDERRAAEANRLLKEFSELARRYRAYWPAARTRDAAVARAPMAAFEEALASLRAWASEAAPHVGTLQEAERELSECAIVERVLEAFSAADVDLGRLAAANGALRARVLVYEPGGEPVFPAGVLLHRFSAGREAHAVVLGEASAVEALEREVAALRGRVVALPGWLAGEAAASRERLRERVAALQAERSARREAIAAGLERHGVALALGDVARASWCFHNVGAVQGDTGLARITGWTDDAARLAAAVESSGARALASFPAAPPGASAPLLLRNPAWARPFELFVRLFGLPGREGADPTMLLAVVSPLLFGYMFGDVGQGLVLLAAGLVLRRRHPALRLLIPGGIAAVAFGFAFGSVFAREDLLHPLWLAPLSQPLTVLAVPLYAGAALLCVGLALRALEAWWRHAFADWVRLDAGMAAVYVGLLAAPWHGAGLAVAAAGAAACLAGHALHARRASGALSGAGELLERTLQILVNTVSFARVGAFALAHAGLSAAVVALAEAAGAGAGAAAVLVAGNLLILVLEGLVVGIQTTRLILFEFFVRFLDTRGREFRPLLPPNATEVHP
jgi:V/A-type H+-transporting ATPase subunit I